MRQPADGREVQIGSLRTEAAKLEAEIARLATAIAEGGDMRALVEAMRQREARRAHLVAEIAALDRQAVIRRDAGAVERALGAMRTALKDWRGMLRQELPAARRALRALLPTRLVWTPGGDRYTFAGAGSISAIVAGVVAACAKGGVAPTGFEPVFSRGRVFATISDHTRTA
jgi:hypothetical protein